MRIPLLVVGGLSAALLLTPTAVSADTPSPSRHKPVVKSRALAAPFNLAFRGRTAFVADGGLNLVGRLRANGSIKTIAGHQPGTSGIAFSANGRRMAFTTTVTNEATFENTASGLHIRGPHGRRAFANTLRYERAHNPDRINRYGVRHPSACVRQALTAAQIPVRYRGHVDSHAYSVTAYRGSWIVADAGANTLWKVNSRGRIKTLAVFPAQPTRITRAMATALGMPSCVAGRVYRFEPVPTDVEVGRDGNLYVTTLPGGPESPVLGPRGALWRVNPHNGHVRKIAGGFLGATNLAVGRGHTIYVAELFGGKISMVRNRRVSTYVRLPGVVSVETDRHGDLWATTMGNQAPPAPGTIVKVTGRR